MTAESMNAVILVEAKIHRCGCTTATTEGGYLAEARFCPTGLRIAEELARLRDALRPLDFGDERYAGRLRDLEAREAALSSHRSAAGVAVRAVRPFDPRNAAGERPRPSPVRREDLAG